MMTSVAPTQRRTIVFYLTVALLGAAGFATSLTNSYAYDDRWVILHNSRLHSLSGLAALWHQTYWPPYMIMTLYRPVTMTAFTLEWAAGRGTPGAFHMANLGLYLAICLMVAGLARRLLPSVAAWIAAAFFAVHPVHVEAVANMVGQSELIVGLCATMAVVLYLRWRDFGWVDERWAAGIRPLPQHPNLGLPKILVLCALAGAAAGAKENGVVVPALLLLAELTVVRDPRPLGVRWRVLRPLVLALVATELAYLALRLRVLGPQSGDLPSVMLAHLGTLGRLWTMVGIVPQWLRLFLWPAHLVADYAPQDITLYPHFAPALILPLLLIVGFFVLLVVSWRRWPVMAFGLAWTMVGLAPVSNVLVSTGEILAERTLFLPSIGAMLALGAVIAVVGGRWQAFVAAAGQDWRTRRLLVASTVGALLIAGIVRSATRSLTWHNSDTVFAQEVRDAPQSYRAHYMYGGSFFDHNKPVDGEREVRIALTLYPYDSRVSRDLAVQYINAHLYAPAIPLLQASLRVATGPTDARVLLAQCLLATGDTVGARREALLAVAAPGQYPPNAHRVLAAAMRRP